MLLTWPFHILRSHRLDALLTWVSITDPMKTQPGAEDALEREVKRLAETSPHLLADIGFEEIGRNEDGQRVFRRRGVRFEI